MINGSSSQFLEHREKKLCDCTGEIPFITSSDSFLLQGHKSRLFKDFPDKWYLCFSCESLEEKVLCKLDWGFPPCHLDLSNASLQAHNGQWTCISLHICPISSFIFLFLWGLIFYQRMQLEVTDFSPRVLSDRAFLQAVSVSLCQEKRVRCLQWHFQVCVLPPSSIWLSWTSWLP